MNEALPDVILASPYMPNCLMLTGQDRYRITSLLIAGIVAAGLLLPVTTQPVHAQDRTVVSGTVTDSETGETLPGVNVRVEDTGIGTATDVDGEYELSVPSDANVLLFSFIGYETERVSIDGRATIDVALTSVALEAEGVVVTALGIARAEQELGYSVQSIDGASIDELNTISVSGLLSGRIAGLSVTQAGSGPGGSSNLVLRGNTSLSQDNQALVVLDGIPINNSQFQPAGRFGGFDFGDGITNLDPNNIASITVLKGASAGALYGTRGGNGAIEITTKKGPDAPGLNVSYRGKFSFETPTVWVDENFQNQFGRGTGGMLPRDADGTAFTPDGAESSFGPRMDGQDVRRFNGEVIPFTPQEDNIRDFFDTGSTITNSVGVSSGSDIGTFRASYTNLRNRGILPNHELDQNTFSLAGTSDITDRLTVTGRATYLKRESFNRPVLTDNPDNTIQGFLFMPRSLPLGTLEDFRRPDNEPIVWNNQVPGRRQNPFWTVNLNTNDDERDRLLGFLQAEYALATWIDVRVRGGQDVYSELRRWRRANKTVFEVSTAPSRAKFNDTRVEVEETNYDALLTARSALTDELFGEINFGASRYLQNAKIEGFTGDGTSVPDLFTPFNAVDLQPQASITRREIQSLYGFASLIYRDYAFLDVTARNDWSSTLPEDNRSFFYPSVSGSLLLTEAFDIGGSTLSSARVRASFAESGRDAAPFQTLSTFAIGGGLGGSFSGQNFGTVADVLPNENVKPEITTSIEVGTDLQFFDDRARLSVTLFDQSTRNQIINIPVSSASGFGSQVINAGEVVNQGIELTIGATPYVSENARWDLSFNFAANDSEVREFPGDIETRLLSTGRSGVQIVAEEGEPFGQMIGETFARNENGDIIVGEDGIPLRGGRGVIGNTQPGWTGGITTNVQYRNIGLDAVIDMQQGGDIYSLSSVIAHGTGNHQATLEGREGGGLVFDGVTEDGSPNQTAVDPEVFWTNVAAFPEGGIDEFFVQDASYVRLGQFTLSYDLPTRLFQQAPVERLRLSLTGNNLFFFYRDTDGVDPTATNRSGSSFTQGLEYGAFPNTRSFGFTINAQF
jgi:TonB-linked SusC/RagA family outer membrane protein